MKNSRGFCLVQELVCFCLTALLLASAVQCFYRSSWLLQQSREQQQAALVVQQVLAGEEYNGRFVVTQKLEATSIDGLAMQEVQAAYGKVKVKLIRAMPTAERLSAAGNSDGTAVGGSTGDARF
ncbi:hypothetical protein [uncultured Phascolarctobacterium sp.]|uniref:hypothetical protein n=1 Tax=uncultured Phascolarctobacterium sp. TaxID=512296 RepID=UPI0025F42225|nr:hypothetical protein [uncultured Phascolarctobacterium sp.]